MDALCVLTADVAASRVSVVAPIPILLQRVTEFLTALASGDISTLAPVCSSNVVLDEAWARRQAQISALIDRHGTLTPEGPAECHGLEAILWLRGAKLGRVSLSLMLCPEGGLIQSFDWVSVIPPSASLQTLAQEAVSGLGAGEWAKWVTPVLAQQWVRGNGGSSGTLRVDGPYLSINISVLQQSGGIVASIQPEARRGLQW